VLQLPNRTMIVFHENLPPMLVEQVRSYDADFVAGREDREPRRAMRLKRTHWIVLGVLIFAALMSFKQQHDSKRRSAQPAAITNAQSVSPGVPRWVPPNGGWSNGSFK
jgi:hypothetical protein